MKIKFENGDVKIDMKGYAEGMLQEFPIKFKNNDRTVYPAGNDMFHEDLSKKLNKEQRELFHTFTAKALFLSKRACPDIQPITAVLCTRVSGKYM